MVRSLYLISLFTYIVCYDGSHSPMLRAVFNVSWHDQSLMPSCMGISHTVHHGLDHLEETWDCWPLLPPPRAPSQPSCPMRATAGRGPEDVPPPSQAPSTRIWGVHHRRALHMHEQLCKLDFQTRNSAEAGMMMITFPIKLTQLSIFQQIDYQLLQQFSLITLN